MLECCGTQAMMLKVLQSWMEKGQEGKKVLLEFQDR